MSEPTFSIITPVFLYSDDRKQGLFRAIYSIAGQTYPSSKFEHIVYEDGSTLPLTEEEKKGMKLLYPWLNIISNPLHLERINCYYEAMLLAKNDWFVFLDSDDQLSPYALQILAKIINENPDYKMFNFGAIYIHKDGKMTTRGPFAPTKEAVGHEIFGGGKIVNGTFIFHRSVYEELGGFPHGNFTPENQDEMEKIYHRRGELSACSPWDFSCMAQLEFPEIRSFFQVDVEERGKKFVKELGNPMGNDFYIWYKYTRKYHSLPVDFYLYFVYQK
ncbi:MAG: glycosyltransferase [Actinomycetota bacterium]